MPKFKMQFTIREIYHYEVDTEIEAESEEEALEIAEEWDLSMTSPDSIDFDGMDVHHIEKIKD